jgi:hypothetical protein
MSKLKMEQYLIFLSEIFLQGWHWYLAYVKAGVISEQVDSGIKVIRAELGDPRVSDSTAGACSRLPEPKAPPPPANAEIAGPIPAQWR